MRGLYLVEVADEIVVHRRDDVNLIISQITLDNEEKRAVYSTSFASVVGV